MNNKFITYCITVFAWLAVLYPLWVARGGAIFPLFGITAFTLLWLHALSGAFEPWLRQHINFDRFVRITSTIILVCILAHPLLLLAMFGFDVFGILETYGAFYIELGVLGWLLLITYDIGKFFKKHNDFFVTHWNKILIISNIGFLITFFHSLQLGSDLQTGPLRLMWIFYGITAAAAIFYTYVLKNHPQ